MTRPTLVLEGLSPSAEGTYLHHKLATLLGILCVLSLDFSLVLFRLNYIVSLCFGTKPSVIWITWVALVVHPIVWEISLVSFCCLSLVFPLYWDRRYLIPNSYDESLLFSLPLLYIMDIPSYCCDDSWNWIVSKNKCTLVMVSLSCPCCACED